MKQQTYGQQEGETDDVHTFKASEEQDDLIARGIKLISAKLLDTLQLCT
jgi:hypothetical protein